MKTRTTKPASEKRSMPKTLQAFINDFDLTAETGLDQLPYHLHMSGAFMASVIEKIENLEKSDQALAARHALDTLHRYINENPKFNTDSTILFDIHQSYTEQLFDLARDGLRHTAKTSRKGTKEGRAQVNFENAFELWSVSYSYYFKDRLDHAPFNADLYEAIKALAPEPCFKALMKLHDSEHFNPESFHILQLTTDTLAELDLADKFRAGFTWHGIISKHFRRYACKDQFKKAALQTMHEALLQIESDIKNSKIRSDCAILFWNACLSEPWKHQSSHLVKEFPFTPLVKTIRMIKDKQTRKEIARNLHGLHKGYREINFVTPILDNAARNAVAPQLFI